jgi:NAD(P)-dependent dehydrogenase (short-subunit alcohol dehydrogenase family)
MTHPAPALPAIVSIGMLAYNEAGGIGKTIASLLAQSIFHARAATADVSAWEIVVVPNGCTDDTAEVAEAALRAGLAAIGEAHHIAFSVRVLVEGGKSNAWNRYVHEMARADADVIVMVDTDIEFGHADTLANCLNELRTNAHAQAVVDLPLKDFVKKPKPSLVERVSMRSSGVQLAGSVGLSGQFYCARAATLRQVWMPAGLSGEDGFLHGMIVTDLFRAEPDPRRVVRAADASHYYEGLTNPREILHHELRMVIGTALNCYFMWDFLKFATDRRGPGAGALIRAQLQADPNWYRRTVENQIRNRGWWALPRGMLFRRFASLQGIGWQRALGRLPVAIVGTLLDIPTFWLANRKLRSGQALGFW